MRWLAFVLMIGVAYSQEPTPGTSKGSQDAKTQTAKSKKKTAQDQRGTQKSPLVVEVLPAKKSKEETTQDAKDREDKAADTRFTFWFNFLLVLFNGILAVSTVLLYLVTARAAAAAEKAGDAAKKSADTTQSVETARLLCRVFPEITVQPDGQSALIDWKGELINVGRTWAGEINIQWTSYVIPGTDGGYVEPNVPAPITNPKTHGDFLGPGATLNPKMTGQIPAWDKVLAKEATCIVRFQIAYRNIFGTAYVTPLCVYYDHKSKNFIGCPIARKTKGEG